MRANIKYNGMAIEDNKLNIQAANMVQESVKIKFSAQTRATPFEFRLPKDITNHSFVTKTERGTKISWDEKKVTLQNPINFTDWITNIENFLLQSVKQGVAQPNGKHPSAKPHTLVKQNGCYGSSHPITSVVDLTGDDDVKPTLIKQEASAEATDILSVDCPKSTTVPVSCSSTHHIVSPSAAPAQPIALPVTTTSSLSSGTSHHTVLTTSQPVASCSGRSSPQPTGVSGSSILQPSVTCISSSSDGNTSTTWVTAGRSITTAASLQSEVPSKVSATARKHTGPRHPRSEKKKSESEDCATPTPSTACTSTATKPQSTLKPTARKRTAPHKAVVPEKKRTPSPDILVTTVSTGEAVKQHPAALPPLPASQPPAPHAKQLPLAPDLKVSRVNQGIVLSWDVPKREKMEDIVQYQLFAYQEGSAPPSPSLWKKVGDVKALALPMACTLTQFQEGNKYHFAVRAMDKHKRVGNFSTPRSIHLTK